MCILFFILNENAKDGEYKLILASNRDELYERPASIAGPWKNDESIIGGRDMTSGREGGTWLAITTNNHTFKLGALLNITGEIIDNAHPRGNIVVDYVQNSISNVQYCDKLCKSDRQHNGFCLLTIEINDKPTRPMYYCNVNNCVQEWPQNEVHGVGNSLTQQPLQKVTAGQKKFQNILNQHYESKEDLVQSLIDLLNDREKHWPDAELQRRAPNRAESLASICVKMPNEKYGSRTHTVILVDANNKVDFYEETMASTDPDGEWIRTHIETEF